MYASRCWQFYSHDQYQVLQQALPNLKTVSDNIHKLQGQIQPVSIPIEKLLACFVQRTKLDTIHYASNYLTAEVTDFKLMPCCQLPLKTVVQYSTGQEMSLSTQQPAIIKLIGNARID